MAQTPPAAVEACVTDSAAPTTVRATVVQAATVFYDTAATLCKAEKLLAEAAALGSQIVLFPEAFIGGYPRGSVFASNSSGPITNGVEQFPKYVAAAIQVPGPEVERLAALAGKYKVFLVMGAIEREGYTLYCTVVYFSPEGEYLGKHRKLIPTGLERMVWGFGDGSNIPVFDSTVGKVGAVICWENKMPLLRTAMYGKGVEIYCAPTADDARLWQSTVTHIAGEGGCFVLSANQYCLRKDYPPPPDYYFGSPQKDDFSPDSVVCEGGSVIISPLGKILAGPNYEGECLLTADLDLGDIAKAKYGFDAVGHFSKPEVLRLTVDERPMKPVSYTSTHPHEKAV